MNLIINTVGGQFLTLTPEMLQEKLGLKSDILSLGIEVSDGNTAITAQSYTKYDLPPYRCKCEEWRQGNAGSNVPASDARNPRSVLPSVRRAGQR